MSIEYFIIGKGNAITQSKSKKVFFISLQSSGRHIRFNLTIGILEADQSADMDAESLS